MRPSRFGETSKVLVHDNAAHYGETQVSTQTVYAADHRSGVYLSTDDGAGWTPIDEGLSTRAVTALAISSDGKVLYAATEGEGVFRLGEIELESIYLPVALR